MAHKNPEPIYKSKCIQTSMEWATTYLQNKKTNSTIKHFKELYATKEAREIDWLDLCKDVDHGPKKFAFVFFVHFLNQGAYCGSYKNELEKFLPSFNKLLNLGYKFNPAFLFCADKIVDLIIYHSPDRGSVYSYGFMPSQNPYIKSEVIDFLSGDRKTNRWHDHRILELFEKSLGKYESLITSYQDFNEHTFFEQITFYKQFKTSDSNLYDYGLKAVCSFYRWLVNKYEDYDFFKNATTMSKYLLFNIGLIELLKDDTYFSIYNPHTEYPDSRKYCFIIRGMDIQSTQLTGDDYFSVDLKNLESKYYRKCVIKYLQSSTSITTITWCGFTNYMTDGLKFITELKKQPNYPNPDMKYYTNQEAILIRNHYHDENLSIATLNNKIGAFRRFLLWCQDASLITFDNMFFEYLKQYEEPVKTNGSTIPDKDLIKINSYIVNDMKENPEAVLMYSIFHLALQTEFRISQICHLKTDCIQPSIKPGQYVICANSKTSRGSKNTYVITDLTYHILMNAIESTEALRNECSIEALTDYIFLRSTRITGYIVFNPSTFNNYLKNACKRLELKHTYSAANLRDTHMTKAFEHILRSGKSDLEMGILSKHKHLDTTKNHYIEMELEKMLEATYGITIGTDLIDTDSKIVDELPESAMGTDSDVENGCGKCTAKSCISTTSLPCLSCKYFVTTVNHEIFFKTAISGLDKLITQTTNAHDKEDLVTIKQLHVLYLRAIYKHKEGI